jgi:hypothetical protein
MTSPRRLATGLLVLLSASAALAAWPDDPLVNLPVSQASGEKYDVYAVTDGAGGAIIAWEDERGGDADIYVQRVSADGEVLWQTDGVPVCTAAGDQALNNSSTGTTGITPLVADGAGGAWLVWQDSRAFGARLRDVYAQRVDADGNTLLASGGVIVTAGPGMEDAPSACSDGAGGIIVAWQDKNEDPVFADIYAQRLGPDGQRLWNGGQAVPVVTVGWDQNSPSVCADGAGGAVIAWSDGRDDVGDVFAQRLDAAGQIQWTLNGVAVSVRSGQQNAITLRPAADGDLLLAWVDRRASSPDIYAQKIALSDGASRWLAHGVPACTAANSQYRPALCAGADGGAIVAWFDYRNAPSGPPWNLDIFAQRLDAAGQPAWPVNGVSVCGAPDAQRDVDLAADGQGGAYLAWEDNRGGTSSEDIYAQHLDAAGQAAWETDGRAVSLAPNNQKRPDVLVGAGGMIMAWADDRDVLYENDVYCARVAVDPTAAPTSRPDGLALRVTGDPEQGRSRVAFSLPTAATVRVEVIDLRGRRVAVLDAGASRSAGEHELSWDHRDRAGRAVRSGVYLVRVVAGGAVAVGKAVVVR